MADFEYLRALAERATSGPWAVPAANVFRVIAPDQPHTNPKQGMTPPYPWRVVAEMGEQDGTAADATFIANVSPDVVIALLDENQRMRALLSWISGACSDELEHPHIDAAISRWRHGDEPSPNAASGSSEVES